MAVLNLRDVPDELARELRVEAAQADVGVREYCVAVLSSRKKIADISVGGGATEGGGDPCLPRGGEAQDGGEFTPDTEIGITTSELGALGGKIFGDAVRRGSKVIPASEWSPSILAQRIENAKTVRVAAIACVNAGIDLDREILERWGLAENYKPKTEEESDGIKGSGEVGQDKRTAGGDSQSIAEGGHGAQEPAVGVGKPGVNMQALRDICAGKVKAAADSSVEDDREWAAAKAAHPDPHEVDLCGFKAHNEEDGEWYVCTKEKHGVKVKHGEWIKI